MEFYYLVQRAIIPILKDFNANLCGLIVDMKVINYFDSIGSMITRDSLSLLVYKLLNYYKFEVMVNLMDDVFSKNNLLAYESVI